MRIRLATFTAQTQLNTSGISTSHTNATGGTSVTGSNGTEFNSSSMKHAQVDTSVTKGAALDSASREVSSNSLNSDATPPLTPTGTSCYSGYGGYKQVQINTGSPGGGSETGTSVTASHVTTTHDNRDASHTVKSAGVQNGDQSHGATSDTLRSDDGRIQTLV